MIRSKTSLIIVLLFPIVALLALTLYKKTILMYGQEVILPITGYDPRNLLSGHYLMYRVDYGVPSMCPSAISQMTGYVCLQQKAFSYNQPKGCKLYISGVCQYGQFHANIERFYIPENKAKQLEEQIRYKKASILISVTADGRAEVKDLLIDGQSWQQQTANLK